MSWVESCLEDGDRSTVQPGRLLESSLRSVEYGEVVERQGQGWMVRPKGSLLYRERTLIQPFRFIHAVRCYAKSRHIIQEYSYLEAIRIRLT